MGKKELVATAFNPKYETYVVYVASLGSTLLNIHSFWRSQISGLITEKASTKIPDKYANFADIFFPDLASKLSEHTGINNHVIQLVDGQQPPYGPIYILGLMKLETLKAYIETNLANSFIRPSTSPASAPILFD